MEILGRLEGASVAAEGLEDVCGGLEAVVGDEEGGDGAVAVGGLAWGLRRAARAK